jgi:hypothetical protein
VPSCHHLRNLDKLSAYILVREPPIRFGSQVAPRNGVIRRNVVYKGVGDLSGRGEIPDVSPDGR